MKSFFIQSFKSFGLFAVIGGLILLSSCGDDPEKENTPEAITLTILTFTPTAPGGIPVIVTAEDEDGDGPQSIVFSGPIVLEAGTEYDLDITLFNGLLEVTDPEYNVTTEVKAEGDEHMFFFSWTNNLFSNPTGNGNIDARADAVNYLDDDGTYPIGLETSWVTSASTGTGKFKLMLKHQPDLKTATSGSTVGETDLEVEFDLEIQ